MKLENILEEFRRYLLLNFEGISSILSEEEVEDWLQANWEVIVEFRLQNLGITKGLIDIYSNGADCNGDSSRVSLPDGQSTNAIHVAPNYIFHSFGTLKNGFFVQEPPYDYVKGEKPNSEGLVLSLNKVRFSVGKPYDEIIK